MDSLTDVNVTIFDRHDADLICSFKCVVRDNVLLSLSPGRVLRGEFVWSKRYKERVYAQDDLLWDWVSYDLRFNFLFRLSEMLEALGINSEDCIDKRMEEEKNKRKCYSEAKAYF